MVNDIAVKDYNQADVDALCPRTFALKAYK